MSAIAGLIFLDGHPVGPSPLGTLLGAMLAALGHRGVSVGAWSEDGAALGVRDADAAGARPAVDLERRLAVVADARLDNRSELRAALGLREATDAELILRAYGRWGDACAERLIGDFAAVVWDARARTVCCLRDPMGVKPFYYHRAGARFAFATEVKALLRLPGVSRDFDDAQLRLFLDREPGGREATLLREVRRLPAAHVATVTPERWSTRRYWEPDPHRPTGCVTSAEYEEAFRAIFAEAVRTRLEDVRSVGATLSGGLDSSAITCMARGLAAERGATLHSFSLTFDGLDDRDLRLADERPYIERVVRDGGLLAHTVRGDALSPLGGLDRVLHHLDEPHFAPNLYLHLGLYAAAQAQGVRVLLDGFDGDTVVSHGFGRLNALARAGDWETFEREVRAFSAHRGIDPRRLLADFGLPYLGQLARTVRVPTWMRTAGQLHRRFALGRRGLAWAHGARHLLRRAPAPEVHAEQAMHLNGLEQPLYQLTLELTNKSAAAFDVDARYPFFDRRLIDFCVAVPESEKFSDGWPRYLFRRAMRGVLPTEVQWRATKSNLAPNFHRRLHDVDRAAIDACVSDAEALARWTDPTELRSAHRRYFAGAEWRHCEPDGYYLFRATVLRHALSTRDAESDAFILRSGETTQPAPVRAVR